MEQNRKKIRIQKVVLSLLSVIFLAMALAGISAMYLNPLWGKGGFLHRILNLLTR